MTPFDLAIVGLRLLAIYCFVQSIPLFSAFGVVGALSRAEDPFGRSHASAVAMALLPGVSLLVAAILLYVLSLPLARRLSAVHPAENAETVCTFDQLQTVSFAVAGILIVAFALPSVFRGVESVIQLVRYKREGGAAVSPHQTYDTWLYCIGVVAQVVLGLLLLLNPRGFRNAWHWLRTART
jgi:hypothetical protein